MVSRSALQGAEAMRDESNTILRDESKSFRCKEGDFIESTGMDRKRGARAALVLRQALVM